MIDLELAEKEFIEYTEKYDLNVSQIKRKQDHSIRVMNISKQIAKSLNLSDEEIKLAELIGLLHDLGRFDQYTQYKTFDDRKSIDHGDKAVEILEKEVRKYIKDEKYDFIIKKAIKNHNKYKIEDGLDDKITMFSNIIRDADKIDIIQESITELWEDHDKRMEESIISEDVLNDFKNEELIKSTIVNRADALIRTFGFIYDINFKESYKIIYKEDYINKLLNKFDFKNSETRDSMESIRQSCNNYIYKMIKE